MINKKFTVVLDEKFYPQFKSNWDNDIFREIVLKYINNAKTCLDIGAGRGALKHMAFNGLGKEIFGIDPSDAIFQNPYLDQAFVGFGENMPFFEDNKFDLIYANNVLEHIENPDSFLKEVGRVIKIDGICIAKTPNKNHYMPLLANFLPEKIHTWYHKLKGRPSEDTFPAFYRLNSRKSVKKYAESAGFEIVEINMIEGRPEYLRFNTIFYFLGIAYERFVNFLGLDGIKIVMYIILRKK